MTDLSLERGHEVFLSNAEGRRLRVSLEPAWTLQRGSRLANANRGAWARTQTVDRATSAQGFVGSALLGLFWFLVVALRWLTFRLTRNRRWTVSVVEYADMPVELPARKDPVSRWRVETPRHTQHADEAEALGAAKRAANGLRAEGFQVIRRPVAGVDS